MLRSRNSPFGSGFGSDSPGGNKRNASMETLKQLVLRNFPQAELKVLFKF